MEISMNSVLTSIAGAIFISVVCEMIMPEGSVKKYVRLAIGFMMISVIISPFTKGIELPELDFEIEAGFSKEELEARNDAYILDIHRKNIEKRAEEMCGEGAKAYAEVFSDGTVHSVRIEAEGDISYMLPEIKKEFGCENIEIVERQR